jgi:hypothetical protein
MPVHNTQAQSVQMVKCAAVRSKHFKASIASLTTLAHIIQLVLYRCGACNDDPDEGSKLHPACESRPGGEFSENAAAQRSIDVAVFTYPRLDCCPLFFSWVTLQRCACPIRRRRQLLRRIDTSWQPVVHCHWSCPLHPRRSCSPQLQVLFLIEHALHHRNTDEWYLHVAVAADRAPGWDAHYWGPDFIGWDSSKTYASNIAHHFPGTMFAVVFMHWSLDGHMKAAAQRDHHLDVLLRVLPGAPLLATIEHELADQEITRYRIL